MPWNKQKAADIAKDYLEENYTQEMEYIKVEYPLINWFALPYTVYFSPVNNADLVFEVAVPSSSGRLKREYDESKDYYYSPDNYLLVYFKYWARIPIRNFASDIWGVDANAYAGTRGLDFNGGFKIPIGLEEDMAVDEMLNYLDYVASISTGELLDKSSMLEEAERILEMIEFIKEREELPTEVLFWYRTGKDEGDRVYNDSATWPEFYIGFKDLFEVTSIDSVIEAMESQWFSKY